MSNKKKKYDFLFSDIFSIQYRRDIIISGYKALEKYFSEEIVLSLRSKKQGDLRDSLVSLGVTPLWHMAQWVFRAPPHNTLPAFQNLNGS